jgi:hypothetical protein
MTDILYFETKDSGGGFWCWNVKQLAFIRGANELLSYKKTNSGWRNTPMWKSDPRVQRYLHASFK